MQTSPRFLTLALATLLLSGNLDAPAEAESPPVVAPRIAVEPPIDVAQPAVIDPRKSPDAPKGAAIQNPAHFEKAKESYGKWKALKKENGDSYEYSVKFQSWVGFSNKTTIVVRDGKVVERRYSEKSARGPVPEPAIAVGPDGAIRPGGPAPKKPAEVGWIEKGDDIGKNKRGAPAKTIDELYREVADILRTKAPAGNHITVRFHKNGLVHLCLYSDKRCADDCSKGVRIEEFKFAK